MTGLTGFTYTLPANYISACVPKQRSRHQKECGDPYNESTIETSTNIDDWSGRKTERYKKKTKKTIVNE